MPYISETLAKKGRFLLPLSEIESGAVEQLEMAAQRDFCKAIAVFPDIHQGYDLPIGTAALFGGVLSASAVGYDIGCGMSFLPLDITSFSDTAEAMKAISEAIPMGVGIAHSRPMGLAGLPDFACDTMPKSLCASINATAQNQIGTLGSGNHFLEIGEYGGRMAVTVHSGSRNPGHSIASFFMKLNDPGLPPGYFRVESELGQAYLAAMQWAEAYAFLNRQRIIGAVAMAVGSGVYDDDLINKSHNHARITEAGVLHRKGATDAEDGVYGVIPINARDGVYVVRGRGNPEYLQSASHGAGRKLGRKAAKRTLDPTEIDRLHEVIATNMDASMLDEAPGAYKEQDYVIGKQDGIVIDVVGKTDPVIVMKGN